MRSESVTIESLKRRLQQPSGFGDNPASARDPRPGLRRQHDLYLVGARSGALGCELPLHSSHAAGCTHNLSASQYIDDSLDARVQCTNMHSMMLTPEIMSALEKRASFLEAVYEDQMRRHERSPSDARESWRAVEALTSRKRAQRIRRGLSRYRNWAAWVNAELKAALV